MSVNVAVVGLGRISGLHLTGYATLGSDTVRVVAVCDVDRTRAEVAAGQVGSGCRASTLEEILADPSIDAVEVLVPSYAQADVVFAVIAAGKHLTVQKPLAGDLPTGTRIVEAAEAAGVHLRVFENTVNHPAWRRLEAIIADGRIGTPLSIYLRWANSLKPCGWDVPSESWEWRSRGPWAEQFAAPTLFDDSAHLLSPAISLFGPVREVVALSGRQRIGSRETGFPYALAWHHVDGGQGVVEGSLCDDLVVLTDEYSADTGLTVTGSAGICWLHTGEGRVADRPTIEVAADGRLEAIHEDPSWSASWPLAQREWIEGLTWGTRYRWTGRDALNVLTGSLAVDRAVADARARRA